MIDCSHGNSRKNHENQPSVLDDISEQVASGNNGIMGVMIESNINAGKQSFTGNGLSDLKYGVSITDACVDWETSVQMLETLAAAVEKRRQIRA